MNTDVIVIGGGAAGLMAAIAAAREGASVTVLEKNDRPGRKLLASGNGKCNLTNRFLQADRYGTDDPVLLARCLQRFSPEDTLAFFRALGLETRDRDGWMYPVTDQASSVLQVLLCEAEHLHVRIKTRECVQSARPVNREGETDLWMVRTDTWEYKAPIIILASGSPASSVHGSSDDALRIGTALGLTAVPFLPALVPLRLWSPLPPKWSPCRAQGTVSLFIDGQFSGADTGELQLTDTGISGIPVFQISREAVRASAEGRQTEAELNFLPGRNAAEAAVLLRDRKEMRPWQTLPQILTGLLPDRIITIVCAAVSQRETEEEAARIITGMRLAVKGPASLAQAQICSGGICLAGLTDDLESRRHPGLYLAGEAVNTAGPCGGYNLQWAWTSGMLAGRAAGMQAARIRLRHTCSPDSRRLYASVNQY